jgi:CRP/FNR family transcriptional regulator, nitrogen oxide reductase regulator
MVSVASTATFSSHLLDGICQEDLGNIFSMAENRNVSSKEIIVRRGDAAENLFLLRRGNVRYYRTTKKGDDIMLRWLVPGDTFGLGSLLREPPPYIGTAEALSDGEVMVWTTTNIRKLAAQYPQLGENALKIVLQYLKNYADRHVGLVSKSAEDRLADVLLILEHQRGHLDHGNIELKITNQQLSSLADISPFTASRLLNKWQRKGTVSKRRAKLVIHVPEALVTD